MIPLKGEIALSDEAVCRPALEGRALFVAYPDQDGHCLFRQ